VASIAAAPGVAAASSASAAATAIVTFAYDTSTVNGG
jgi:hypothetical protein